MVGTAIPVCPLFVPADRPERFGKAAASGADAVILDLEDGVPAAQRDFAREALATPFDRAVPVFVRINGAATAEIDQDLATLQASPFDGLMLARTESAADVARVRAALGEDASVIVLIETAAAFPNLAEILTAPGVIGAAFGSLDLALDLGCDPSWEALSYCRGAVVLACRLAGLPSPLDGVWTAISDPEGARADARRAVSAGFGGKLAIHPSQVAPILDAFHPDPKALDWARRVLDSVQTSGAAQIDGMMIDRPVIERARRLMDRARPA